MKPSERMALEDKRHSGWGGAELLVEYIEGWAVEAAQLEAENEALKEYVTHKPGCYESGDECICELDELLTGEDDG